MKGSTLDSTLGKSSKEIPKGKDKLKNYHLQAAKQYNSMCEDLEPEPLSSPVVAQLRDRQHSKKDVRHEQVGKLVRSKSRQIDRSNERKGQDPKRHDIGALYSELMAVKSEYKKLKVSYQILAKEKTELTSRGPADQVEQKPMESEKGWRQLQRCRKNMQILQCELQRIRKECLRVVQTEKFKNKRLEEIIQEKDLTIAYLRAQLEKQKKWHETAITSSSHTSLSYNQTQNEGLHLASVNCSQIENVVLDEQRRRDEDSLCFSCDPSKEMESVSSLLGNNPKKDKFIVEPQPKFNEPFTQPSQCLTFQQREEEVTQARQMMKLPPRQKKELTKPKVKSSKKMKLATHCDQNVNKNGRFQDPAQKQLMLTCGFTKHRKKASSSRKRN